MNKGIRHDSVSTIHSSNTDQDFAFYTKKAEPVINSTMKHTAVTISSPYNVNINVHTVTGSRPHNHYGNSYYSQIKAFVHKSKCYRLTYPKYRSFNGKIQNKMAKLFLIFIILVFIWFAIKQIFTQEIYFDFA